MRHCVHPHRHNHHRDHRHSRLQRGVERPEGEGSLQVSSEPVKNSGLGKWSGNTLSASTKKGSHFGKKKIKSTLQLSFSTRCNYFFRRLQLTRFEGTSNFKNGLDCFFSFCLLFFWKEGRGLQLKVFLPPPKFENWATLEKLIATLRKN